MNSINKILFITLSNIGDVILTLPALDALRENFPQAKITVVVSVRAKEVFENNPNIERVVIYDKRAGLKSNLGLFRKLKAEKFDLVADLRNSLFGALLPVRYKTSPCLRIPGEIKHMRDKHLYRLRAIPRLRSGQASYELRAQHSPKTSLYIKPEDEEYINGLLKENGVSQQDKIVVIAPGARSHIKRWPLEKFAELIALLLKEFKGKVILAGDKEDLPITQQITQISRFPVIDLCAKTNLMELACLLKHAACVITNDSAVLHLSSYLNRPTVAIFGPTNEAKYGPWSSIYAAVKKEIFCRPCEKAQCRFGTLECMHLIKVEDVLREVRNILAYSLRPAFYSRKNDFKRILIVRTDRIGDVLLSTPVIKALRDNYPHAYIAMMVAPYAKEIVAGNPSLDGVITYDKDFLHKSWARSMRFALALKKKKFNLAIILHPTNRVHLVTFFAGIAKRVGYDRKMGFLLTDRIKHLKQLGEKHELEYSLDLLKYLGIEPKEKDLFMPLAAESEKWAQELLQQQGIKEGDRLLAIHPGASCPSKIWLNERFAEVADKLAKNYGFKVLLLAGPKDIALAQQVMKHMRQNAINLAGKTSVSQLASLLKRCQLFISNDSGPVHIASAVGTPVISIFGRNQAGLSPRRWGPRGEKDKVLHKPVGCIECLAHNCKKEFACLKAISVDDVLMAADEILK